MKGKCFHFALAILAFGLLVPATVSAHSPADAVYALMATINGHLEDIGADYRAEVAEYITFSQEQGQTVFFSDVGNKQVGFQFVPGDPRRFWNDDTNITYIVDQVDAAFTLPIGTTTAAIDRAMATWEAVNCSTIPINRVGPFAGVQLGVLDDLVFPPFADITHAGWVFFIPPPVLAVTITFGFFPPTDIDNDGNIDVWFSEIYYSNLFFWFDDGVNDIDVETIALHEAGHGLSQGHFGKLFRTDKNGKFHFAPRALMNAAYTGPQRSLRGTDNGGHCSIWASWPNN